MVVKSVAGFMNAHGGTLLLGVANAGDVFGIEKDMRRSAARQNRDGFGLWLTGLLDNMLGPTATSNVTISFEEFEDRTVCRVDVDAGSRPTFLRGRRARPTCTSGSTTPRGC